MYKYYMFSLRMHDKNRRRNVGQDNQRYFYEIKQLDVCNTGGIHIINHFTGLFKLLNNIKPKFEGQSLQVGTHIFY
jgi:hypothetical protein